MESHPQNSEFRNNPENFHPCYVSLQCDENQNLMCCLIHRLIHKKFQTPFFLIHITNGTVGTTVFPGSK